MAMRVASGAFLFCSLLSVAGGERLSDKFVLEYNLAPWADHLLKLSPVTPSPMALAPDAKFTLVLAAERTRRPDILHKFRLYRGGWNITNRHYFASVGFTGAAGFLLASLWIVSFGFALGALHWCRWGIGCKEKGSFCSRRTCLILLLIFTSAASSGCILLSVGQVKLHDEAMDTLSFVVHQSDFTVQILKNVTDFLSLAKAINVDKVYLPSAVQDEIDKLNADLYDAASALSKKTTGNSKKIRQVFNNVRIAFIAIATVMFLFAILGFMLSMLGYKHAIYIFIMSGWLLVAVTFVLCGLFIILNNVIGDTCIAMDEWVHHPLAETALSSIFPCVDEKTTNLTLHQSKEVIRQLVNVVNTAISSIANSNSISQDKTYFYNQSGPLMPLLCSPYDSELISQQCETQEVSYINASVQNDFSWVSGQNDILVWQNYTCVVSDSGSCVSIGRVTPDIYVQLVAAVNVSYALDYYTPLLLSLQNCNFVRKTFNSITMLYCPQLKHDLQMVNAGLALISTGVMLCLILWVFYANCRQKGGGVCEPN